VDEARAVLERLERIEDVTDRDELIAELRELVGEVEAWTAREVRAVGGRETAAAHDLPAEAVAMRP
jgi:hypothetical protein